MKLVNIINNATIFNKKLIAASYIYKYTLGAKVAQAKCLTASDAEVFEFIAKEGSRITEQPIKDLEFPSDAIIGGYIRGAKGFVAKGDTHIQENDKVVVFALPSAIQKLDKYFK